MMCGKAELASKLANSKFANIFERVFITGRFPYIAGPPTYQSSRRWSNDQKGAKAIMAVWNETAVNEHDSESFI